MGIRRLYDFRVSVSNTINTIDLHATLRKKVVSSEKVFWFDEIAFFLSTTCESIAIIELRQKIAVSDQIKKEKKQKMYHLGVFIIITTQ